MLCTAGAVLGARSLGLLEAMELVAYDAFTRMRYADPQPDPRIALVTVTESEIRAHGGRLSDDVLAQALEAAARYEPRAIGLDIYRDVPIVPGTRRLQSVLAADPRIVVVMKSAEGRSQGVRPPSPLQSGDRVGFSDILVDPGGVVRRGLLFLNDETHSAYAFSLRLALLYLQAQGVTPQPDPRDATHLQLGRITIPPFEANDGGYVRADARGYQFLLDFKGAPRPFATVELGSLLAGTVAPELLRDKIVIVGVIAESVGDVFYTPWSRGLKAEQSMPGMAIHAHVASQLLRMALDAEKPIAVLLKWQEWLWIVLWSVAGVLIGLVARSPWHFAVAALGGIVALSATAFGAFLAAYWIPLVPAALAWLSAAAVVTAVMSYREAVQRALLMQLFSRHVSREVAEAIWRQRDQFLDGGRPRPERLVATVLFSDLTGFTATAEKHSPEAVLEWLNEYMNAMTHAVSGHGGVIRQYAGDAIVAVFGIPVARKTDAEVDHDACNAVSCALTMQAALTELNRRWAAELRPTTGMRIGILTGPVVAGTLGSAERSEYVIVGDTVNTAERLEGFDKALFAPDIAAHPVRILIGESTLRCLGGRFQTQHVGEVGLRGKEQRINVYMVTGGAAEPDSGAQPATRAI